MIVLQNVIYHNSSDLLKAKSAESDYQSEGLYAGPEFGNLDEDLQVLFERYLDERGINTALALFVPDYIEFKEQREYLTWLESMKPPSGYPTSSRIHKLTRITDVKNFVQS